MIARLARGLLLLEFLLTLLTSAAFAWLGGMPAGRAVLCALAILLLVRLAITSNNFIISWRHGSATPAPHRLNLFEACLLFLGEFRATLWSTSWSLPFQSIRSHLTPRADTPPVLLIHGWGCNSGYWHSMSKALTQAGIAHRALDLEPVLGDIDGYVPAIDAAVEALCRDSGWAEIVIVGHSMGGLVARAYMRKHGCARVARAITLGSPHHGTVLANLGKGANSRQMHWHEGNPSDWLVRLNREEPAAVRARIVSLYSHHDNIIAPQTSSHLDGAINIEYRGIGHVALALHPLIQARVIAEARAAAAIREKRA
jgi:triacylglycerol lipase